MESGGSLQYFSTGRELAGARARPGKGPVGPGNHSWCHQFAQGCDVVWGHSAAQVQVQGTESHSPPGLRFYQEGSIGAASGNGQMWDRVMHHYLT